MSVTVQQYSTMGYDESAGHDAFSLPREWQEIAQTELNEGPGTARNNIERLRNLILSEKDLYAQTDDIFLLAFLRARKHNVEDAFKLLKNFYRLKKEFPKHTEDCLPSEKPISYEMNGFTVLAERDQHGRKVIGIRVEEVNLNVVRQEDFFQMMFTVLLVQICEPLVQVAGVTILVDMTGFSLRKAAIVTPTFARIAMRIIQDSFPLRMKAIHVVFEPVYFDAIFSLFKPFLKEKLRKRIYLHGYNLSSLHTAIPQRLLPPNLKGLAQDWNFAAFRKDMELYENTVRSWRKYGYGKKPGERE